MYSLHDVSMFCIFKNMFTFQNVELEILNMFLGTCFRMSNKSRCGEIQNQKTPVFLFLGWAIYIYIYIA